MRRSSFCRKAQISMQRPHSTRSVLATLGVVAALQAVDLEAFAAPGGNGNGNGNAYGYGYGNGKGRGGGGGGAPLPALGVTLLGQAIGAGGLYAVWRRRKARSAPPAE